MEAMLTEGLARTRSASALLRLVGHCVASRTWLLMQALVEEGVVDKREKKEMKVKKEEKKNKEEDEWCRENVREKEKRNCVALI